MMGITRLSLMDFGAREKDGVWLQRGLRETKL